MSDLAAVERRLSPSEKVWWLYGRECSVNFVMHSLVKGRVSEDVLLPALKAIQDRHPLLRVCIKKRRLEQPDLQDRRRRADSSPGGGSPPG